MSKSGSLVQSKSDREKQKLITDKCQSLIEVLLKDEDNKYCVDCDAKGPRWASWNLGIFLCIRCAGIHRNLGVHISRVKSVNLDAWTPDHVAYVQRMGNKRAREIYEANLPDDFRRPQTDIALESFIRSKYEHRKYISPDYKDPGAPPPAFSVEDELKKIKEQKRTKSTGITRIVSLPLDAKAVSGSVKASPKSNDVNSNKIDKPSGLSSILIDLDSIASPVVQTSNIETLNQTFDDPFKPISKVEIDNPKQNQSALDLLIGDLNLSPAVPALNTISTPHQQQPINPTTTLPPAPAPKSQFNLIDF